MFWLNGCAPPTAAGRACTRQAAGNRDAEDGDGLRAEALDLATEQAGDDAAEQRREHHAISRLLEE
jgi:hypothetical protein